MLYVNITRNAAGGGKSGLSRVYEHASKRHTSQRVTAADPLHISPENNDDRLVHIAVRTR